VRHLLALVAGVLAGIFGSFVQAIDGRVLGAGLPVGLVIALAVSLAAVVGSGRAAGARTAALLAVLGWLLAVLTLAMPRAEGDVIIASGTIGITWLYAGAVLVALGVLPPYGHGIGHRRS
jgi:hypothetical protein